MNHLDGHQNCTNLSLNLLMSASQLIETIHLIWDQQHTFGILL